MANISIEFKNHDESPVVFEISQSLDDRLRTYDGQRILVDRVSAYGDSIMEGPLGPLLVRQGRNLRLDYYVRIGKEFKQLRKGDLLYLPKG